MKLPSLLLLLCTPFAEAALVANVVTDKGTIVVELQYAKAPKAVANFMTLAKGTRARTHAKSGAVTTAPLYVGEKFFRVVNDASFKIIQSGSGTGTNNGGPGFNFKDEFDATLTHVPYVLSMANNGHLNTNGSQIFFTGNVSIPSLNNVHTIFGLVTDTPSRAVIDAILTAGNNGTTITSVTFDRTDAGALAFNENAQDLPVVSAPSGTLAVQKGLSSTWNFSAPLGAGKSFRAFRSNTLANGSWSELTDAAQLVENGPAANPPTLGSVQLDAAPAAKAFYRLSTTSYSGAVGPATLANRTVSITISSGVFVYQFDATGAGGTVVFTPTAGSPISSPFLTLNPNINPIAPGPPYAAGDLDINFDSYQPGFSNPQELWVKIGCNDLNATHLTGRYTSQVWNGFFFQNFAAGNATITR